MLFVLFLYLLDMLDLLFFLGLGLNNHFFDGGLLGLLNHFNHFFAVGGLELGVDVSNVVAKFFLLNYLQHVGGPVVSMLLPGVGTSRLVGQTEGGLQDVGEFADS